MDSLRPSGSIPTEQTATTFTHKVGDWAVIVGQWSPDIGQITKVTDNQIRTQRSTHNEAYHKPRDVVFSGTKEKALDLKSVIVGLQARDRIARQQLADQHKARVSRAIAKANSQ